MNNKTIIGFCFCMLHEKSKLDQGQIDGQCTLTSSVGVTMRTIRKPNPLTFSAFS